MIAKFSEKMTELENHCAYCGGAVSEGAPVIERFGERFCSENHAEEFAGSVRAARIQAAARTENTPSGCAMPLAAQRTWKDYVKRGACWGAPLLLLLAVPLFWTGNAAAATGGSILSVLAFLACPLGMYFMMRGIGGMGQGQEPGEKNSVDGHDVQRH
jgi:hypothetical protein